MAGVAMTSDTSARAWNPDIFSINAPLYIAPVGHLDADEERLNEDELAALRERQRQLNDWFEGFEPLTEDMRPGSVFAQYPWDYSKPMPKTPPPVMSATYSAVNAACRALLEQYDLGATEFYPITVLNIAQTEPIWPEIYLMHVRNRKASIDIAARVADGTVSRDDVSAEVKMFCDKHGIEPPVFYEVPSNKTATLECCALEGPDIWFEDKVGAFNRSNLYISDRLKSALETAGMTPAWRLKEAPIRAV